MNKAERSLGLVHQIRFSWLSGQWPSPPPNVRQPCGCCHIPKDAVSVPKSAVDKRLEPSQKQTVVGDQKARLHLYLRQTAADQAASARLFRFFLSHPRFEVVRGGFNWSSGRPSFRVRWWNPAPPSRPLVRPFSSPRSETMTGIQTRRSWRRSRRSGPRMRVRSQ